MSTYRRNVGDGLKTLWYNLTRNRQFNRGAAWGLIIISALAAFEIFNFSTTQFALTDVLGDLGFGSLRWATILAIAFCGIDFAGIARIFTPEQGRDEPAEVYYLFGAWVLAAGFNATLTWWGVSVAIVNHSSANTGAVLSNATMIKVVPIFVAAMVWLIRLLLIGTFSLAGDRLFTTAERHAYAPRPAAQPQTPRPRPAYNQPVNQAALRPASSLPRPAAPSYGSNFRPAPKPTTTATQTSFVPPEPTYHPVSYGARASDNSDRNYDA
jgi:hypothetical protein